MNTGSGTRQIRLKSQLCLGPSDLGHVPHLSLHFLSYKIPTKKVILRISHVDVHSGEIQGGSRASQ